MPSQTFTHRAISTASPTDVWAAMDLVATWEKIPGIDRVVGSEQDDQGRLESFSFEATVAGRPYRGRARRHDRVEEERISWRITSPDVNGSVAVDLTPVNEGTEISVDLTVAMDGFLASLFFPAVTQALGRGFPDAVQNFASALSRPPDGD